MPLNISKASPSLTTNYHKKHEHERHKLVKITAYEGKMRQAAAINSTQKLLSLSGLATTVVCATVITELLISDERQ